MWWAAVAAAIIIGVGFVHFFGNWSVKKGWYDDYEGDRHGKT